MKILEAYDRLGLEDPAKYRGGIFSHGEARRNGKTTRIAIEMALDVCYCVDPSTDFRICGPSDIAVKLYRTALNFVNTLCPNKVHFLQMSRIGGGYRPIRNEKGLQGMCNCFVYSDVSDPLTSSMFYARKFFTYGKERCRALDRDDISVYEGPYSNFLEGLERHNMSVDDVVRNNRIWNERYFWRL